MLNQSTRWIGALLLISLIIQLRNPLSVLLRALSISLMLFYCATSVAGSIGIATGSASGNYINIGKDIARLLAASNIPIHIIESNGSLENVAKVLDDDSVHMGLVQSDVLGYIQASNHKVLKKIPQKIKLMFPLYNEEVHLLARKSIQSIADLQNKIVGVGAKGSGTNLTTELLFEISNVWPQRKVLLDNVEALQSLSSGEIDALFFVSGYPVSLFENIDSEQFHLVSLDSEMFTPFYTASRIPANTYPWQAAPVNTLAVRAMLMTYDFVDERCAIASEMVGLIQKNLSWLVQNGHPKWKEVDLDSRLPQWERYPCVAQRFADGRKYELGAAAP